MSFKSLKHLFVESQRDINKDYFDVSSNDIDDIGDVSYNNDDNYIKINFLTTEGSKYDLIAELDGFKRWAKGKKKEEMFSEFVKEFIETSNVEEKVLDEIIDKDGNIFPDGDGAPNNATNRFVGFDNKWDLQKIYSRNIPKSIRNYSGNLGLGSVVW